MNIEQIKEIYPPNDWGGFSGGYGRILHELGEIVIQVDDDDYQGDSRVLVKKTDLFGYLNFGWGSCSGCDSYQGCTDHEDLLELANSLEESVKWLPKIEMLEFFRTHDWKGDYRWDKEDQDFVTQVIEYLSNIGR